ncbi:MAG TPA: magnesium/cobalt transporter CorA [Candidatus Acidoferrales bacterium]|nr:magnesium/cobalt transporter CorA [Candidatus Acidoferrales bacterium]
MAGAPTEDTAASQIVNCVAYREGKRVGALDLDRIHEVLHLPDHLVWVGVRDPDEALLHRLQKIFGLHDLAIEDAFRAHQRPKVEEYADGLFVVLRTAYLFDGKIAFGETHLFVGVGYVVAVRHGASLDYEPVRVRCESTPQLLRKGPGFVLYAVMDYVVDQYFPIVDALEDQLEVLEEEIFGDTFTTETTERIYNLKRDLVALKRAVSPLVEVCNRLVRFDSALIPEDARVYFRDVYDHVIRINETVDNLRELLTTALEANLSLIAVRQNDVMKKLAAWAAILAIPTAIAGIYGMNFDWMPELHVPYAYPIALVVMAVACAFLHRSFKRAGWL